MDESAYRRVRSQPADHVSSQAHSSQAPGRLGAQSSSQSPTNGPPTINLKSLKNVSLSCAKNLTSKIKNFSSSRQGAPRGGHGEGRPTHYSANPNSLKNIAIRLSSSTESIMTHRELVAVIEMLLTWSEGPVQVTLEKDRYGAPTRESINNFSIINSFLLEKTLAYVAGRRDCCIFIVKFVTWRMRTTKHPEEIILSLELINACVERMGPYFLSLMTKPCMRTFRKILFMTTLKHSIASGMKKQITKLLGKNNYVHPGVSTDVRIHIFKAKTLYMIQLWYETFLLDQGVFPVFFEGYKDLRARGVRFPSIDPADKARINTSIQVPRPYVTTAGTTLPLAPDELDRLLKIVNNIDNLKPGPEFDRCVTYLRSTKNKIVDSISILTEECANSGSETEARLLDRMLTLNDAIGTHLKVAAYTIGAPMNDHNGGHNGDRREHNVHSGHNSHHDDHSILTHSGHPFRGAGYTERTGCDSSPAEKAGDLLNLDSDESEADDAFGDAIEKFDEDSTRDFFDDFCFSGSGQSVVTGGSSRAEARKSGQYFDDLLEIDLFNTGGSSSVAATMGDSMDQNGSPWNDESSRGRMDDHHHDHSIGTHSGHSIENILETHSGGLTGWSLDEPENWDWNATGMRNMDGGETVWKAKGPIATPPGRTGEDIKDGRMNDDHNDHSIETHNGHHSEHNLEDQEPEGPKKTLNEMVSEFDTLDLDFGHMSVTGF